MTNRSEDRSQRDEQPTPVSPTQESSSFDIPDLEPKKLDADREDQVKGGARMHEL